MEKIPVRKIARVLYVLVLVTLACNLIALFLVPTFVALKGNLFELLDIWHDPQDPVNPLVVMLLMWPNMILRENIAYEQVLTLFLLFSGGNPSRRRTPSAFGGRRGRASSLPGRPWHG